MEPIRINQSTTKRLNSPIVCPQRYYREEVTGEYRRPASESMIKGQRFEYITFGTKNREGEVPVIPPLKNGKKSTDEIRIEAQSRRMIEVLKGLGIRVIKTNFNVEYLVNGVIIHGTQDILADWGGEAYILDCKLTANVNSTFGAYSSWGLYKTPDPIWANHGLGDDVKVYIDQFDALKFRKGEQMDMLQPHSYMYQLELKTRKPWKFAYIVADYKPKTEIKVIKVLDSKEGRANMLTRLGDTKSRLQYFIDTKYAPIPTWQECETCPVKDCLVRLKDKPEVLAEPDFTMFDEAPVEVDVTSEPLCTHSDVDSDPFA